MPFPHVFFMVMNAQSLTLPLLHSLSIFDDLV
uniref:Uncharacterized protein n=1 Tax=Rhizophora mucronata TaxID=61149 RepID=A0A2P2IRZ5_RHIMU